MSESRTRRLGLGRIALIVLNLTVLVILATRQNRTLGSITIDYIFCLPSDLENLRLRVAPGGWSGEPLKWLEFGRKEFRLT
jgi:hypothetical protein